MHFIDECLKKSVYDSLPDLELHGVFTCKVVRVYDGDTFHAALIPDETIDNGDKDKPTIYRVCCRLIGINTPEIPRSYAEAHSAPRAYAARDRLFELATGLKISDEERLESQKQNGNDDMPSLTDAQLQSKIDTENKTILHRGITMHGTDKYGRHLACLNAVGTGEDVSSVLLREELAEPYGV